MTQHTDTNLKRYYRLDAVKRDLIHHYIQVQPSEQSLDVVFSLMDEGVIEFAETGTANEHLHVKHPRNESPKWCIACTNIQLGLAA